MGEIDAVMAYWLDRIGILESINTRLLKENTVLLERKREAKENFATIQRLREEIAVLRQENKKLRQYILNEVGEEFTPVEWGGGLE